MQGCRNDPQKERDGMKKDRETVPAPPRKRNREKQLNIQVTFELHRLIKAVATLTGQTMEDFCADAIRFFWGDDRREVLDRRRQAVELARRLGKPFEDATGALTGARSMAA